MNQVCTKMKLEIRALQRDIYFGVGSKPKQSNKMVVHVLHQHLDLFFNQTTLFLKVCWVYWANIKIQMLTEERAPQNGIFSPVL